MHLPPLTSRKLMIVALTALAFLGSSAATSAALVVIDFSSGVDGLHANYAEDGFEINPIPPNAVIELKEFEEDQSLKVIPGSPNRDDDKLTKTGGGVFTLNSLVVPHVLFDGAEFAIVSSAGGLVPVTGTGVYLFAGPLWTNITFVDFINTANTTSSKTGFIHVDNITLNDEPVIIEEPIVVPEPGSLALLGIGALSCLGYGWRQRRRAAA